MDKKNRTELLCLSPKKTNNNRFKLIYHFDFFLQKQPELGATGEMSLGGEWRGGGGRKYFQKCLIKLNQENKQRKNRLQLK